ncbi:hypothetical protein [Weissella cibaria]|uniref:hypothetical protein n=1 Tax=Weissella cibaria TaxID=137591 RepID=UPI001E2958BB|nr:hypothetical protein [Weissella cibaria]
MLKMIKFKTIATYVIVFIVAVAIQLPQIYSHAIILGNDSLFHMNRFFDAMMQIKEHSIGNPTMDYGFGQTGRIINAVYGPAVALVNGFILLVLGSWYKYEVFTGILVGFLAGSGTVFATKKLEVGNKIAVFIAAVYMSSFWVNSWATSQMFTAWGAALMPFVVGSIISVIKQPTKMRSLVSLSLTGSLLIQTHMLSAIVTAIGLVLPLIATFLITKDRVIFLKHLMIGIALVGLLNVNVITNTGGLFLNNDLIPPFPNLNMENAATIFSTGSQTVTQLGLILSIVIFVQISASYLSKKSTSLNRLLTTSGSLILVISSQYFPWQYMADFFPVLQSFLQFPLRLTPLAVVFILMGLALSIKEEVWCDFQVGQIFLVVLMLFSINDAFRNVKRAAGYWNTSQVTTTTANVKKRTTDTNQIRDAFTSRNLAAGLELVYKNTPDYLPTKGKVLASEYASRQFYTQVGKYLNENKLKVNKSVVDGKLIVTWRSQITGKAYLPVVVYSGATVRQDGEKLELSTIKKTDVGSAIVNQHKGINEVTVEYGGKWQIVNILSIISWLLTLTYMINSKFRIQSKRPFKQI